MLLLAALGGAPAGAAPVTAVDSKALLAPGAGTDFMPVAPTLADNAGLTTLQELLTIEERDATTLELAAALAHRPGQALSHGLLADLDTALRLLQEAGYDGGFVPPRETGQGAFLRVAQRSASRSGLY